ncbi:DUF6238 family protein [Streptomyces sp. NPDC001212]|uniref:DUF6238 family protein n=1 Tax=Streptomyces sp. NPDC001312 TaxID=3364561 RepID=UPI0036B195F4
MTITTSPDDTHPYLRAASAGIRHHRKVAQTERTAVDRGHLDVLHAHLIAVHQLVDQLADTARSSHPAAGRRLTTAQIRLWQATAEIHSAFHLLPAALAPTSAQATECRPERLPEGPPVLTICQRHLAAGHIVRRKNTPTDLNRPPHTTACIR